MGIVSEHALLQDDVACIEKPFAHDALGRKIRQLLGPAL
jgi:hypothetical protein